jgi:hypothetical protein
VEWPGTAGMEEKMKTIEEIREIVNLCKYPEYKFSVFIDGRGEIYLQAHYNEPDTITGKTEIQATRRWFISPQMTRSEIVQTCFKCIITSTEHRAREWFTYREKAIFGPHFNVDVLHAIMCENPKIYDNREEK